MGNQSNAVFAIFVEYHSLRFITLYIGTWTFTQNFQPLHDHPMQPRNNGRPTPPSILTNPRIRALNVSKKKSVQLRLALEKIQFRNSNLVQFI